MEGRFRKRKQTDRGKVQETGSNCQREGPGKGSRLTKKRLRRREPDDGMIR